MPRRASAVLLLSLLSMPSMAAADGAYAGLGVGPGASLGGDYGGAFSSEGHAAGQIFGGYRFGPWSAELAYFGTGMSHNTNGYDYTLTAASIRGKYHLLLGRGIELYLRLGLDRTNLNVPNRPDGRPGPGAGYAGTGINYGTGLSWQSQPLGTGRIRPRVGGFLDLGVHRVRIDRAGAEIDYAGSVKTVQIGVISSIDF